MLVKEHLIKMAEKQVLIIQNIPREGPGIIQQVLDKNSIKSQIVDLSQNHPIPPLEDFKSVVVMGGPDSANDDTPKMKSELGVVRQCLAQEKPYLGICLGMQDLVKAAGGQVVPNTFREIGFKAPSGKTYKVTLTENGKIDPLFAKMAQEFPVFHLHGETVIPSASVNLLAEGNLVKNQIVKVGPNAYGIQGHLELTDEMLETWLNQDPWLQEQNAQQIREQFKLMKTEYTQTAWTLITNFLEIAGLA